MDDNIIDSTPNTNPAETARGGDTLDGASIFNHSEGLLEASAAFEQQMEQMQRWKQQLAGQMDLLRKDGLKLLERQKKLAQEREAVSQERTSLSAERAQVAAMKQQLESQLAGIQQQQTELQEKLQTADGQRVELTQLETQRAQVRDDMRTAEGMLEEIARKQAELTQREHALTQRAAETQSREVSAVALEQRLLLQEVQVREMTEQLEVVRRELLTGTQKVEARNQKLEQLEQELAEQMMLVAAQTKRLAERRAAATADGNTAEAAAAFDAAEDKQKIASLTRERDTHAARIAHLVEEINQTDEQVATLEAAALKLSQQAQRTEELQREKQAADQKASALTAELERAAEETLKLKEQLNTRTDAQAPAATTETDAAALATLQERCKDLEAQLARSAAQLKETLDFVDLQAAEAALVKSAHEADAAEWKTKLDALEQEKTTLTIEAAALRAGQSPPPTAASAGPDARPARQRGVLVRQVRSLRNKRKTTRELLETLEDTRAELGKQLQQVRVRRDNLEQVKRLLEKQETIMARKLADHNALKTVAAVGILLIMILGSTFVGVYRFINPEFRGEALVQLNPPADIAPDNVAAWLSSQAAALRANPMAQQIAWQTLRQDGYVMHDSKEGWGLSLAADLTMPVDLASKSIAVQVRGWNAEGVAQSSNALAAAFATVATEKPADKDAPPLAPAAKAAVLAKATVPLVHMKDQRLMLALSCSGTLMGLALIAVFFVRKLISRQLKEIDQMADAKDLEDLNDDMASVDTAPA